MEVTLTEELLEQYPSLSGTPGDVIDRDAQERFQRSGETISRNVSVDFNQIYKH